MDRCNKRKKKRKKSDELAVNEAHVRKREIPTAATLVAKANDGGRFGVHLL